ncbi:MAG: hypothetical protein HOP28_11885 [Gemmatimonadales bacterium]|nr:hypothetical protein [Gemmatimonadales bacterium]
MTTLLETLLAFVGTMLVFALAAQSVQEVLKTMFVIKGRTMLRAVEGLVREATKANRQWTIDADAIIGQVLRRVGALGQFGLRPGKIRLDALPAAQLEDLIAKVEPADIPGLPGNREDAREILKAIAKQARDWYPIAVQPVEKRYRRRMRVLSLLASALVVVPFNLDAIRIYALAQSSPEFRADALALVGRLDSAYVAAEPARPAADSIQPDSARADSAQVTAVDTTTTADSTRQGRTLSKEDLQQIRKVYSEDLLGRFRVENLREGRWWLGILLSIVLVSLGAPFWHDLLESLFGFKKRLAATAASATSTAVDAARREG